MTTTTDAAPLRSLGPIERIPRGEGRCFRVGTEEIAVFRTRGDEVYAVQAACPHGGGPLADGLLGGRAVVCPLHSFAFDLETGAPLGSGCPALRTYRVSVSANGELRLDA